MVLIMDGQTPKGRRLTAKRNHSLVSPCVTRKMTEEEREFYGLPNPPEKYDDPPRFASLSPDVPPRGNKKDPAFGERIKEEREKRNMSIKAFGKLVGVSSMTVSNIEKAVYGVKENTRKKICDALGWGLNDV